MSATAAAAVATVQTVYINQLRRWYTQLNLCFLMRLDAFNSVRPRKSYESDGAAAAAIVVVVAACLILFIFVDS